MAYVWDALGDLVEEYHRNIRRFWRYYSYADHSDSADVDALRDAVGHLQHAWAQLDLSFGSFRSYNAQGGFEAMNGTRDALAKKDKALDRILFNHLRKK